MSRSNFRVRGQAIDVRNLERAGISPSVAMKPTGHKTEAVYRRYPTVAEADLREAGTKLAAALDSVPRTGTLGGDPANMSATRKAGRSRVAP